MTCQVKTTKYTNLASVKIYYNVVDKSNYVCMLHLSCFRALTKLVMNAEDL